MGVTLSLWLIAPRDARLWHERNGRNKPAQNRRTGLFLPLLSCHYAGLRPARNQPER
jgi:hypothetical protein